MGRAQPDSTTAAKMTTYFNYPEPALQEELKDIANRITAPGKGILAADESTGTIGKRFAGIGAENNLENRKNYRQMLFTTPGLEQYVSGVILFEETLYTNGDDGRPLVAALNDKNIICGIKVDKGVVDLMNSEGEGTTQGLDDLDQRCAKYLDPSPTSNFLYHISFTPSMIHIYSES